MLLKKLIRFIKDGWSILGIALIMLVMIELVFSLTFYIRSYWHPPAPNFRINADTYSDHAWAAQYYDEIDQIEKKRSLRWKSYVYWRRMPRRGTYINITPDGLRKTSGVTASEGTGPTMKVFMFGGSTMWGYGAGDDFTIPSIFAREAKTRGVDCETVNFGQYAYVNTQGVIELMTQLQKGNIPDAVIFYDGVNDTFGAFQLSLPGLSHDEISREKEFGLLKRKEIRTFAIQSEINDLSTVRFLNGVLKSLGLRRDNFQSIPMEYEIQISDRKALAHAVVDTYLNNFKVVRALAESYGFKFMFYWQPVIYMKKHLTEYERKSLELDVSYPGLQEFYVDTYDYLRQRAEDLKGVTTFHDISSIFGDDHQPIFVDFNHMGDKGNTLIARRMVEDYVGILKESGKSVKRSDARERLADLAK